MNHGASIVWHIERYFEVLLPCPLEGLRGYLPAGVTAQELQPHRFWGGVPVAELAVRPVMALIAPPGDHSLEFWPPRPWRAGE